jgi:hypothetical protein
MSKHEFIFEGTGEMNIAIGSGATGKQVVHHSNGTKIVVEGEKGITITIKDGVNCNKKVLDAMDSIKQLPVISERIRELTESTERIFYTERSEEIVKARKALTKLYRLPFESKTAELLSEMKNELNLVDILSAKGNPRAETKLLRALSEFCSLTTRIAKHLERI